MKPTRTTIASDAMGRLVRETWPEITTLKEFRAVFEGAFPPRPGLDEMLAALTAWCSAELEAAGLPPCGALVVHDGAGNWRVLEERETPPREGSFARSEFYAADTAPKLSRQWFVAQLAAELFALSSAGDQGPDDLFRRAVTIGGLLREIELRDRALDSAERGERVAGGARNSAQATNARHEPLRERRFARIEALMAEGLGIESAAAACEAEGLGTAAAIKRQWHRHRGK